MPVEYTPTVNDLADLLADAMRRPLTGSARRPDHIHFRGNPRWEELFPHLKELGIEVTLHDDLPEAEEVHLDFCRQMRKGGSGPIIMLSHRPTRVEQQFPAIGAWVQESLERAVAGERADGGRAAPGRRRVGLREAAGSTLGEALGRSGGGIWPSGSGTGSHTCSSWPTSEETAEAVHDA
jgi:hypothetical protein